MKAVIVESFETLPQVGSFSSPQACEGEALVHPIAATINPINRAIAAGQHYSSPKTLPVICGIDGVGRSVDGEVVYFMTTRQPFGAMAEIAPADWTVPVPHGLDPSLAASVVNPAIAAWLPLQWRGRMQRGDTVLIMGATGAAGGMAIKAARLLGAGRIIAAGRNEAVLAELGADEVIDLKMSHDRLVRRFQDVLVSGLDIIVDFVWGASIEAFFDAILAGSTSGPDKAGSLRVVSVGAMGGATVTLPSEVLRGSRLEIVGSGTANLPPVVTMQKIVKGILGLAAEGKLTAKIVDYPFADATAAWADALERTDGVRPVIRLDA